VPFRVIVVKCQVSQDKKYNEDKVGKNNRVISHGLMVTHYISARQHLQRLCFVLLFVLMSEAAPLLVFEYGGTGRSGKGSIVQHLANTHPGVVSDETGADYRALTRTLITDEVISPDMPGEVIAKEISSIDDNVLTEMVANRKALVETVGLASLYEPDVQGLVASVSPLINVRKAVKAGFAQRVRAVRDSEAEVLLVDGRTLAPIIEKIRGTRLVLRTFVSCYPAEAALREVERQGLEIGSPEGRTVWESSYGLVMARNEADATRTIDPVRPDADAIDYWADQVVLEQTIQDYMRTNGVTEKADALMQMFPNRHADMSDYPRTGAATFAVNSGRQLHFNTTPFRGYTECDPREAMLDAATVMFDETLEAIAAK